MSPSCWAARPPNAKFRCAPARPWPRRCVRSAIPCQRIGPARSLLDTAARHRCRVSGPARLLWRRRHGAGAIGKFGRALHRLRPRSQPPGLRQSVDKETLPSRPAFPPRASWCLTRRDAPWPAGWQPPVVLKPVRQGSSVGLQMVDDVGAMAQPPWPKPSAMTRRS